MAGAYTVTVNEAATIAMLVRNGREMYGFEIAGASGGRFILSHVYTILERMEGKGLIKSRKEKRRKGARGLSRRFYRPTAAGKRALAEVRELLEVGT